MKSPVLPEKRTFKREVCLVKISATTRGQVMMQKNWLQSKFTVTEPVPIEIRLYERALTGLCLVQMCLSSTFAAGPLPVRANKLL